MRRFRATGPLVLVVAGFVASLNAAGLPRATHGVIALPSLVQRSAQDFQWHGLVLQGSAIEIKGVNGDVTAGPGTGTEVEVTATRRGRRSDPEDVKIDVVQHGDGVTICAVYPSTDGRPNECRPGHEGRMNVQNNDVTVTFDVRVPAGVRFIGHTVNGDVEAKSLSGPVDVKTVNGGATFSTSAYGEASTVNGSIQAAIGTASWPEGLAFKTVNGSITLDLPGDTSADVRASTVNGDITTDFPLTVTGKFGPRRLNGTIGGGGRTLELETVNGSVRLRRTVAGR
jgi:putative adhesin